MLGGNLESLLHGDVSVMASNSISRHLCPNLALQYDFKWHTEGYSNVFCILQDQLHKREEEHARERKNLLEQLEKERRKSEKEKNDIDKKELEVRNNASLLRFEPLSFKASNQIILKAMNYLSPE